MRDGMTFCIPTKNNLRYLKSCIESIIGNSTCDNEIIVYVDADEDGTSKWLRENKIIAGHYLQNQPAHPFGLRPQIQNN